MTKVIARVYPVHLMNVDWAPGGRQPSDQANRLGLWGRRKLAATVHIHHCHCCYYSARKLILILPSLRGWKAESTSLRLSSSGHNTDAARALAIAAASGLSIDGTDRRADTVPIHSLSPLKNTAVSTSYRYRPWGGETICRLPPADGSSTRGGSTSVSGRVRSPHTSGGRRWLSCRQPACL